jgi:predicted TIM-barrel fold metal-dependent hydrolase
MLSGAWDHGARLEVLDGDGIAGEIIFVDGITEMNSPPFGAGLSLPVENVVPELQWAGARAHNRWLAELCQMAPDRRRGVAVVPATWDVDEAIAEVRWARRNGLGSIMIPVMWQPHAPYHHPKYDPLWSVCEELDVVVHFHSGPAASADCFGNWPPAPGQKTLPGGMGIYVCEAVWTVVRPLTFFIWGGIFERHPGLRVAITEATTTWAPNFLEHLDERYVDWHVTAKLGDYRSHLSMKPSDYFRRNGYTTYQQDEFLEPIIPIVGEDNILWGADYPHPDCVWPESRRHIEKNLGGLPERVRRKITRDNVVELYRLGR